MYVLCVFYVYFMCGLCVVYVYFMCFILCLISQFLSNLLRLMCFHLTYFPDLENESTMNITNIPRKAYNIKSSKIEFVL